MNVNGTLLSYQFEANAIIDDVINQFAKTEERLANVWHVAFSDGTVASLDNKVPADTSVNYPLNIRSHPKLPLSLSFSELLETDWTLLLLGEVNRPVLGTLSSTNSLPTPNVHS